MKTLLICPSSRAAIRHLAESGPLAAAPVLGGTLAGYWIERLAEMGAREVSIVAAERHEEVKAVVGDGKRWGVRIEVHATGSDLSVSEAAARFRPSAEAGWLAPPHDIVVLSHLPGVPDLPLFHSYAGWFAAVAAWMPRSITPGRVGVGQARPGVWIGRGARISPRASLVAPCWIGSHVLVGSGAVIGPEAILEDRVVVAEDARIARSHIGPDTFVGRLTSIEASLASGSLLTNYLTESSLRVPDPFLLSSTRSPEPSAQGAPYRRLAVLARAAAACAGALSPFWPRAGNPPH